MKTIAKLICSVLCVVSLTLAPAHAALLPAKPVLDCDNNGAITAMDPDAIDCSGAWGGNDANQQADVLAQLATDFGGLWIFADKYDIEVIPEPAGPFIESVVGTDTGTITFTDPIAGIFAIALKSDGNFSLYKFDGGVTGISSIDYVTDGVALNAPGSPQDLSHASLYLVPEPSSLTLLAFCVLGICGVKRRRTL